MVNNSHGLKTAWNLFWLQNLVTLVLSIVFGFLYGREGVIAAWMGGLSAILPAATSAQLLFRGSLWNTPRQWFKRFVRSEMVKILLSLLASSVIFYWVDPLPGVMFCAWAVVLMVYRLLPNQLRTE
jgi:F0F1-type ATP synthase assembly protein I